MILKPLDFFGVSFGNANFLGIGIEHEAIGLGMLGGAIALRRRLGKWFLPVAVIGFILWVSERLFVDFNSNPTGSIFSIVIGLAIAFLWSRFGRRRH